MKRLQVSAFFLLLFLSFIFMGLLREAITLLAALVIHEGAHLLTAWALGCTVNNVSFQPLGSMLSLDQVIELAPFVEIRIALAGPAVNLLTAMLTLAVAPEGGSWAGDFIRANLVLMAFNLLPALPLDGGRVLRASLIGWVSFYKATTLVVTSGFMCGIGLLVMGLILSWQRQPNITIFAAAIFLIYSSRVEKRHLMIPLMRYVLVRQRQLKGKKLLNGQVLVASPGANSREVFRHIRPQHYYLVTVLAEDWSVLGHVSEHRLLAELMEGGMRPLAELIREHRRD